MPASRHERVLTQRELNRALLARQLLLERSTLSIDAAVEQVGGLQTQPEYRDPNAGRLDLVSAAMQPHH